MSPEHHNNCFAGPAIPRKSTETTAHSVSLDAGSNPSSSNPQNPKPSSDPNPNRGSDGDKVSVDDVGSPLSVIRAVVVVCLLERVPFSPIDSSTLLRKMENDQSSTPAEKAALRELTRESGSILAVEMALRLMVEDNGGIEVEEFVVSGKSRLMVLEINRTKLVKELPESNQCPEPASFRARVGLQIVDLICRWCSYGILQILIPNF